MKKAQFFFVTFSIVVLSQGQSIAEELYSRKVIFEGKYGRSKGEFIWYRGGGDKGLPYEGELPVYPCGPRFDNEGKIYLLDYPNLSQGHYRIQSFSATGKFINSFEISVKSPYERIIDFFCFGNMLLVIKAKTVNDNHTLHVTNYFVDSYSSGGERKQSDTLAHRSSESIDHFEIEENGIICAVLAKQGNRLPIYPEEKAKTTQSKDSA